MELCWVYEMLYTRKEPGSCKSGSLLFLSESKVVFSIVVGYVFYHLLYERQLGYGYLARFDFGTQQVAQDTAEVFVTGVRKETARIGEHPYETA